MGSTDTLPEFVRTVQQRLGLIDALVKKDREMRELVERVDGSRSTVRRGVRELETFGFISRTDGGYRATLHGRLVADACREYIEWMQQIRSMEEALRPLPPTFPLEPAVLRDADAYVATGPAPYRPLEPIKDVFPEMTAFRAMNATIPDPWFIDHLHERMVHGELTGEMLVTPALFDVIVDQFAAQMGEMAATGQFRLRRAETFRFGLLIAETTDTHVYLVVGNRDGATHAVVHATSPAARRWATDLYEQYREPATDVTARLESETSG